MSFSAYEVTIPVMTRGLGILDDYLDEAVKLSEAQSLSMEEILSARLAPGMLSFAGQIGVAAGKAERHGAMLSQLEAPKRDATAPTVEALRTRLREAIAYLEALPEADILGAQARTYELSTSLIRGWFGGDDYILEFVLPDFFFHQALVHAILRHLGADIGKRNYLGRLSMESGGYT